jgi:hypothetical protein
LSAGVITQTARYGLELVDGLTGGPLVGWSSVVETSGHHPAPYRVNASRWVLDRPQPRHPHVVHPVPGPATFVITAQHYVPRTVTTGTTFPNPPPRGVPGYLARIHLWPRTGYPFPATLTRVVGLVRFADRVDPNKPPVPLAAVTFTAVHQPPPPAPPGPTPSPTDAAPITIQTTDDGQYTFWLFPVVPPLHMTGPEPPLANQVNVTATAADAHGVSRSASLRSLLEVIPNVVTYAPTLYLS